MPHKQVTIYFFPMDVVLLKENSFVFVFVLYFLTTDMSMKTKPKNMFGHRDQLSYEILKILLDRDKL